MLLISVMDIPKSEQHSHAHKLLRECLSHYGVEYNKKTEIIKGELGKPSLRDYPDIHYNISHADGVAACIVSDNECGIDCEGIRPYRPNVVRRVFSESEKALLESTPEDERDMLFFRLWTLKESYVKMIGIGVSYPMNTVEFSFSDGEIISNQKDCKFAQYIIKNKYIVSVCKKTV